MPDHPRIERSLLHKTPAPEHKFTVGSHYRPGWPTIRGYAEPIPFLPLAGDCLDKAGFEIGAQVWVEAEPGRLIVRLRNPSAGGSGHGPGTGF